MRTLSRIAFVSLLIIIVGGLVLMLTTDQVCSQASDTLSNVSGPIRPPAEYQSRPLSTKIPKIEAPHTIDELTAVAIVGDVGGNTDSYTSDMEQAVSALTSQGFTVYEFYYGDTSFTWADIVNAASGAEILLYMGHGVYWGGSATNPTSVGGFYLGNSQFVSPNQIRTDLAGQLAEESVVILSHACFSAGSSWGDPTDLSLTEAARRVEMYAAPFVDVGVKAYYANNYYGSARDIVNMLLEDFETRKTVGGIFKNTYPYRESDFRDLSYETSGYDLWLSGSPGDWDHAFVGPPTYVFKGDTGALAPELGTVPDQLSFVYSTSEQALLPKQHEIVLDNVGSDEALTWTAESDVAWLTFSSDNGVTPQTLTVTAQDFDITTPMTYTGLLTITVHDPTITSGSPQTMTVKLTVEEGDFHRVFLPYNLR